MKVLIVALVLVVTVAASHWTPKNSDELQAIRTECTAENPLSEKQLKKMDKYVLLDEEPVRKYILCNSKKVGLFSEDEGFHVDRIAKQYNTGLEEAERIAIAEKCADKNVEKSSADVWALRGLVCLLNSKLGPLGSE